MPAKPNPLTPKQQALAASYAPLAESVTREYEAEGPEARDALVAAAYYGLTRAAQTYNPEAGVRFATFALIRIHGAIKDWLRFREPYGYRPRGKDSSREFLYGDDTKYQTLYDDAEVEGVVFGTTPDLPVEVEVASRDLCEHYFKQLPGEHAALCRLLFIDGLDHQMVQAVMFIDRSKYLQIRAESLVLLSRIVPPPRPGLRPRQFPGAGKLKAADRSKVQA